MASTRSKEQRTKALRFSIKTEPPKNHSTSIVDTSQSRSRDPLRSWTKRTLLLASVFWFTVTPSGFTNNNDKTVHLDIEVVAVDGPKITEDVDVGELMQHKVCQPSTPIKLLL